MLVNNAAHQASSFRTIEEITDEEWDMTFRTNVHAMFYLTKAAVPHMQPGAAIINTDLGECGLAEPELARLCHDERRDPELHRRSGSTAR